MKEILRHCLLALCTVLAVVMCSACSGGSGDTDSEGQAPGKELRSEALRITAPDSPEDEVALQVTGNTTFALELYGRMAEGSQNNLFFSPHSIEVAMAMTFAGAREDTENNMAGALHFELPQAQLHPVFNRLDLELASRGEGAEGTDGEGFRLNVLNALWAQDGFAFLEEFLDILALNYGAGLRLLDFGSDPDGSAEIINDWVEYATEDRIQDLIPKGAITAMTRLVLVNAIYFNAAWMLPFEEESTVDGAFTSADGRVITVPMMRLTASFPVLRADGYNAVELPYDGEELSMVILAPEAGTLEAFEALLDTSFLETVFDGLKWGRVELSMPRWKLEGETISLKQTLADMGMGITFSAGADFSGMTGQRDLFIQDILHQAFVEVTESGTEAAAATAVIMCETSEPGPAELITLDHPFIYFIMDKPTGQILFAGRVADPGNSGSSQ